MKRFSAILLSVVLAITVSVPLGSISTRASENTDAVQGQELVPTEESAGHGEEQGSMAEEAVQTEAAYEKAAEDFTENEIIEGSVEPEEQEDILETVYPPENVPESVIEVPADPAPEAVIETPADPVPEAVIETPADPVPEAVIETPADPVPEAVIEAPADPAPEPVIEAPAEVSAGMVPEMIPDTTSETETVEPDESKYAIAETWKILPEGSQTINGGRENIVNIHTEPLVPVTLNTELYAKAGIRLTYAWYTLYPESGWFLIQGERNSSLTVTTDYGYANRYMCKATDQYGNTDSAYFHLHEFIYSISSPNGHLQCQGDNVYYIDLPIKCTGTGSDGEKVYEPVTFEADIDAEPSFTMNYECAVSSPFVEPDEYVSMSGKTATFFKPGEYYYMVDDPSEYYNVDDVAYIIVDVYDPEGMNVYPEGTEIIDGEPRLTVTKTIEQGESITLTAVPEDSSTDYSYSWYDPYRRELIYYSKTPSYTCAPILSGPYMCIVDSPTFERQILYFNIIVEESFNVVPAGYADSDRYDAELNRITYELPENGTITLTSQVSGENIGALSYTWRSHNPQNTDLETGWEDIVGASSSSIQVSPTVDTLYECRVTNSRNRTKSVYYLVTIPEEPVVYQDLAEAVVTLSSSAYTYSGKTSMPAVTVKYGDVTLTEGKDYILTYSPSNLVSAGTKSVKVEPAEGSLFTGSQSKNYVIKRAAQPMSAAITAGSIPVAASSRITVRNVKETAKVTYVSSNKAVAEVNSAGTVTARKVGSAVITITAAQTGNYAKTSKKITVKVLPAATGSFTAAAAANGKGIKLTWKKVSGASGYVIRRQIGTGAWKTIKTTGNVTTFTDPAANTNGTKYSFRIYAKASTGTSTKFKSAMIYKVDRPAVTTIKNNATRKMYLKWGRNTKANGYLIQYSLNSNFSSVKQVMITSNATVTKMIGNLTKNKTYYVRIRTYKTVGGKKYWSAWSPARSVKIIR